jgi:hypothetical protein
LSKLRELRQEPEFSAALDQARATHPRIDDEFAGVEWVLSRSPEAGVLVDDTHYLYVNDQATKDATIFTILYRFDADRIYLVRVWIA